MSADICRAHPSFDHNKNECPTCGASYNEIADNLMPVCEPVAGPHRLALIALRRQQRVLDQAAASLRRDLRHYEDGIAGASRELREADQRCRDIAVTIEMLKAAP